MVCVGVVDLSKYSAAWDSVDYAVLWSQFKLGYNQTNSVTKVVKFDVLMDKLYGVRGVVDLTKYSAVKNMQSFAHKPVIWPQFESGSRSPVFSAF